MKENLAFPGDPIDFIIGHIFIYYCCNIHFMQDEPYNLALVIMLQICIWEARILTEALSDLKFLYFSLVQFIIHYHPIIWCHIVWELLIASLNKLQLQKILAGLEVHDKRQTWYCGTKLQYSHKNKSLAWSWAHSIQLMLSTPIALRDILMSSSELGLCLPSSHFDICNTLKNTTLWMNSLL
jgi:hypothetical protein